MKTKILPLFAIVLFTLGACQEDLLIVPQYIRDTVIVRDTVERFLDRVFLETDTIIIPVVTEVPVPTRVQDTIINNVYDTIYIDRVDTVMIETTVFVDRIDSVFIERIIYEKDTISIKEIVTYDTVFVYGGRGGYQVPHEIQEQVTGFYLEAQKRGYNPNGGLLTVWFAPIDEVLQAYSYESNSYMIIINSNVTLDQAMIPLFREMARWQLKKQYSKDPTHPMYPFFEGIQDVRWSNRSQHTSVIDKIFN